MSVKEKLVLILYKSRVTMGFIFGLSFLIFSKPVSYIFLIVGISIALLGELIRLFASGYIIKTERLATYGPYSYVRHPLYLGSFIMGLGLCISVFSFQFVKISIFILLLFLLLFFIVYIPVLKKEENVLIQKYGDVYLDYKKTVPMLIPCCRHYKKSSEKESFHIDVFLNNKEYRAVIGLVGVLSLIVIKYISMV